MLYFENLSGVKEDEYLRDGITEDIITELSKIKGLKIFSRPTVLAYRDKPVTPAQIGQQLKAAYVLAGSLRRAGNRLRINAAAGRHADRLPALVRALRPRDEGRLRGPGRDRAQDRRGAADHAVAAGAAGARRQADREPAGLRPLPARQELRAAADPSGPRSSRLQMFENAVALDPAFALRLRRHRQRLRAVSLSTSSATPSGSTAPSRRASAASAVGKTSPRCWWPRRGSSTRKRSTTKRSQRGARAIERKPDCEGRLLPAGACALRRRPLPGGRRHGRGAIAAAGDGLQRLRADRERARRARQEGCGSQLHPQRIQVLEAHLKQVPEDARGRASAGQRLRGARSASRTPSAKPTWRWRCARTTRSSCTTWPACLAGSDGSRTHGRAAQGVGRRLPGADWARRDPDLAMLHGDPEFEKLYPDSVTP